MAAPPPPPAVATVSSVIDLTDQPVIDLTASDRTEGSAPLSGRGVLIERRERLRDLIAREREEAEATAPVVALHRAADVAPFPLPPASSPVPTSSDPTGTPRRVPKAVRPDAAARPLRDDVAAAIARLGSTTGKPTGPEPLGPVIEARFTAEPAPDTTQPRRFEFVPLDDPAPHAPVLHLPVRGGAAAVDPRDGADSSEAVQRCPACNAPAVLDIVDHVRGVAHYGCRYCFRTWNEPLTEDH